jgi:hypothetical protein
MQKRSIHVALALALGLALSACGKSPEQWVEIGKASASKGKHEQAVAAFDKALAKPSAVNSAAQLEKARSLFTLKRWAEAARSAQQSTAGLTAVAARPARVLALQALAEAGDKAEGAKALAALGPDALKDPVVLAAALKLGLSDGSAAAAPAATDAGKKGAAVKGAAPVSNQASKDVGKLDAVRIGIRGVSTVKELDKAQFPLVMEFQDPRATVKVPSPDGKQVVWRGKDAKGYCLFLGPATGGAPKRLNACKNGFQPVWSPDGKKILYSAMDWQVEERNLFIYDVASGKSRRAFNAKKKVGGLSAWSPDGGKIVFTYFDDLWMMNANGIGRSLLNLSGRINKPVAEASLIAWSADGSRLAYRMRGEADIYVLELAPKI